MRSARKPIIRRESESLEHLRRLARRPLVKMPVHPSKQNHTADDWQKQMTQMVHPVPALCLEKTSQTSVKGARLASSVVMTPTALILDHSIRRITIRIITLVLKQLVVGKRRMLRLQAARMEDRSNCPIINSHFLKVAKAIRK